MFQPNKTWPPGAASVCVYAFIYGASGAARLAKYIVVRREQTIFFTDGFCEGNFAILIIACGWLMPFNSRVLRSQLHRCGSLASACVCERKTNIIRVFLDFIIPYLFLGITMLNHSLCVSFPLKILSFKTFGIYNYSSSKFFLLTFIEILLVYFGRLFSLLMLS